MSVYSEKAHLAAESVESVILGKNKVVERILLALLANGHVLLEDVPGVGKTTLALAFSKVLGLSFHRVQFTPDVMPSDLTGFSIYKREQDSFVYQEGSLFCNLLLADELNRTSPKTQSALLEAMEEKRVTVEGTTRILPEPFWVIATQNPLGGAGTQPLPESQMDRFMISLSLGYPDAESELAMAKSVGASRPVDALTAGVTQEDLLAIQAEVNDIFIKDSIYEYIVSLVRATREHPLLARGASPRAVVSLVRMSKAAAWFSGKIFVSPNDVLEVFEPVAGHRVALSSEAKLDGKTVSEVLKTLSAEVKKPSLGLLK